MLVVRCFGLPESQVNDRLAGVEADPDAKRRRRIASIANVGGAHDRHGTVDSDRGRVEDDIEGVALGLHLGTVVARDLAAHEGPVITQEASGRGIALRLDEARVVAQVGEQESPRDRGLCLLSLRFRWLSARHAAILGGDVRLLARHQAFRARDEIVDIERLREDLVNAGRCAGGEGFLRHCREEENWHTLPVAVITHEVEDVEPAQSGELDIEDEEIGTPRDERIDDEGAVRDRLGRDVELVAEREAEKLGDAGVVLSDEDVPHDTMIARMRRNSRWLTQTLHMHMALYVCTPRATWHVRCSGDPA